MCSFPRYFFLSTCVYFCVSVIKFFRRCLQLLIQPQIYTYLSPEHKYRFIIYFFHLFYRNLIVIYEMINWDSQPLMGEACVSHLIRANEACVGRYGFSFTNTLPNTLIIWSIHVNPLLETWAGVRHTNGRQPNWCLPTTWFMCVCTRFASSLIRQYCVRPNVISHPSGTAALPFNIALIVK